MAACPERAGVLLQHVHDRARRQGAGQRNVQRARPPAHVQRAGRQLGDTLCRLATVRIRWHAHVPRVHHAVPGRRAAGLPGGRAHRIHVVPEQPGADTAVPPAVCRARAARARDVRRRPILRARAPLRRRLGRPIGLGQGARPHSVHRRRDGVFQLGPDAGIRILQPAAIGRLRARRVGQWVGRGADGSRRPKE